MRCSEWSRRFRAYPAGITLPAGSRAIAFYGAANRDERKFPNPSKFDVTRNSPEQLAFGTGPHVCVGLHLARLEMVAIFRALAMRVKRFHIEEEARSVNNVLRGAVDEAVDRQPRKRHRALDTDGGAEAELPGAGAPGLPVSAPAPAPGWPDPRPPRPLRPGQEVRLFRRQATQG